MNSLRHSISASVIALAMAAATPASADSYLDALKAEAAKEPQADIQQTPQSGGSMPRTDDQVQMERWLQQEFMGTYVFYQKLSDRRKLTVYEAYRDGAPIEELRTKINGLMKQ